MGGGDGGIRLQQPLQQNADIVLLFVLAQCIVFQNLPQCMIGPYGKVIQLAHRGVDIFNNAADFAVSKIGSFLHGALDGACRDTLVAAHENKTNDDHGQHADTQKSKTQLLEGGLGS